MILLHRDGVSPEQSAVAWRKPAPAAPLCREPGLRMADRLAEAA